MSELVMNTHTTTMGAANTTAARDFIKSIGFKAPKHTPAPWSLGASYDNNPHGDFEVYGPEYGHYCTGRVAVVDRRAGGPYLADSVSPQAQRLTAEANARLIAAAPELFDIVDSLRHHVINLVEQYGDDTPVTGGIVDLAIRARSVIAQVNNAH